MSFPISQVLENSVSDVRHKKDKIVSDLTKEWEKLGKPFDAQNEWLNPEEAVDLCKAHFQKYAIKGPGGQLAMPPSVPYPGKGAIFKQALTQTQAAAPDDAPAKEEETSAKTTRVGGKQYSVGFSGEFCLQEECGRKDGLFGSSPRTRVVS